MRDDRDLTQELPREGEPAAAVWLRIEGRTTPVPLVQGEALVLGAGPRVDVRVPDPAVSARHCRLTLVGGEIDVLDLGSRNGVLVAGARVERASLVVGASFAIGRSLVMIEPRAGGEAEGEPLPRLVGSSPAMRRLAAAVRRVAALRLPVLLRGESGTGKDLCARAIHDASPRAARPFVAINAATISRELAESELFGHERGAFTGAVRDRRGAFREAHQGTLFLDEIASLPSDVQAKLLRVVEEGVVRPVGAEAGAHVDVRLVVATCEPLEAMVAERRFRADLYERLAVCVVQVPPLRARTEDIPELAKHLLATSELGDRELSAGAIALLRAYRFPGNVRELRNLVVQAAIRGGRRVRASDVAAVLSERAAPIRRRIAPVDALRLYEEVGRNVSAAARRAELPRSTMRDLLRGGGGGGAPRAPGGGGGARRGGGGRGGRRPPGGGGRTGAAGGGGAVRPRSTMRDLRGGAGL